MPQTYLCVWLIAGGLGAWIMVMLQDEAQELSAKRFTSSANDLRSPTSKHQATIFQSSQLHNQRQNVILLRHNRYAG